MAKILVTGGAGFIGSHVVRQLVQRGDEVVIVDDFNDRYDPRLKEARVTNLFRDITAPQIVREDIVNLPAMQKLFAQEKFDSVIHLAAWAAVQTSIERPHIYTSVNIDGTVNILETARQNNVQSIIFSSSSSVYGGNTKLPFKETDNINRPISPYAATKAAGEILCATWHHLYAIPIACLRFFTVYGPWGRPEMAIFKFSDAILHDRPIPMRGRTTERDFTYIDDCVQGIIAAHDKPQGYQIYNLGEADTVPLPRFITALEAALGRKAIINEVALPLGDVPRTLADISKAQQLLGYQPTTKIEAGVEKFIKWYNDWFIPEYQNS